MNCPGCETPADVNDRFCRNCGKPRLVQADGPAISPSIVEGTTRHLEGVVQRWSSDDASVSTDASPEGIIARIKRHKFGISLVLSLLLLLALLVSSFALFRRNNRPITSEDAIRRNNRAIASEDAIRSLAVIHSSCCNRTPEDLAERISQSVRNSLSPLPQIKIIAPGYTTTMGPNNEGDPMMIGRELGVRALLTVRAVQSGHNDFSINAALIDTRDRRQLWGEQYNRRVEDLQTVQAEISRDITDKLKQRLLH
jgi:TolB-like protein